MNSPPRARKRSKQPLWITLVLLVVGAVAAYFKESSGVAVPDAPANQTTPADASTAGRSPPVVSQPTPARDRTPAGAERDDGSLRRAIAARSADVPVIGGGRVVKVLPDDNDGSRHQKMLVALADGGTVLIAHNIDVAPRAVVDEGDPIRFKGEYVWTDRGGVVHWTHRDPAGRHPGGWLKVNGKTFQ